MSNASEVKREQARSTDVPLFVRSCWVLGGVLENHLGFLVGAVEPLLRRFEACLGHHGAVSGALCRLDALLGGVLGPLGRFLRLCWGPLAVVRGRHGAVLGRPRALLGRAGALLRACRDVLK